MLSPGRNSDYLATASANIKSLQLKAQQGDAHAQYQIGHLYTRGEGVPLDYSLAADYLEKATHRGHSDAQFLLGALYQQGKGVAADYERAVGLYRKAAEQGHTLAQFNLAYCYEIGEGVEKNPDEALVWYHKASDAGDEDARQAIIELEKSLPKSAFPAPSPVGRAAATPAPELEAVLSTAPVAAPAPTPVAPESVRMDSPISAALSVPESIAAPQPASASTFASSTSPASDDPQAKMVADAEAGDANAQFDLGIAYVNGIMGQPNYETAVKWIRRAAEQGLPEAQLALGAHYHRGEGVSQDYTQAVGWYRKAALQGNAAAQFNLGYCHEISEGVPKNRDEAIAWYRRAAAQGDPEAKAALQDLTKGEATVDTEAETALATPAAVPQVLDPAPAATETAPPGGGSQADRNPCGSGGRPDCTGTQPRPCARTCGRRPRTGPRARAHTSADTRARSLCFCDACARTGADPRSSAAPNPGHNFQHAVPVRPVGAGDALARFHRGDVHPAAAGDRAGAGDRAHFRGNRIPHGRGATGISSRATRLGPEISRGRWCPAGSGSRRHAHPARR